MAAAPDVKAECERLGSLVADTASYGHRWAIDLLLSALAAAAGSYRRSTATTPFPDALFSAGPDGGRDYAALLQALQALPPTSWMATGGATGMGTAGCYEDAAARAFQERLSAQQRGLLLWLLEHPRCRLRSVRRVGLTSVQAALPRLTGWVADIGMNPSLRPSAVFCLEDVPDDVGQHRGRILAFHGTSMENLHSILHNGLVNASGTRLERTGAAFGKGIYFSTQLPVAFAFCQPAEGWQPSALGRRTRALLVCSLVREHVRGAHNSDTVPDKYLVVERMDAVKIHYVFMYSDDEVAGAVNPGWLGPGSAAAAAMQPRAYGAGGGAGGGAAPPRPGVPPLLWVLLGFTLMLLAVSLRDNWALVRRWLRRSLGLPLY